MKLLIIEDEPRAANQLQSLLQKVGLDYELLDLLDSVESSVAWLKTNDDPDLIFMDIQLADGLSFEIFQHVQFDAPIIFTTAFDEYAIQAFKVNSVDYLLKPIKQDDLDRAIEKWRKTRQQPKDSSALQKLIAQMLPNQYRASILAKEGGGFISVPTSELQYIYSEESVTFGFTAEKRFIINETIDQIQATLDPRMYYRINRSQIIHRKSLVKVDPYFNHRVKVTLIHTRGEEFIVSRAKTSDFKSWLNS